MYPLNQSPFFKLENKRRLASLLYVSLDNLKRLAQTGERYDCWDEKKKSGGLRRIEAPHEDLKAVQKRIAVLLQKILPPEYLMAPVKGRSYVSNAAVHLNARAFCLLDLEDFFPSCTQKRVYWFFSKIMMCSSDVAALLAKVATFQEHLPQGSPCSPILAYYSYKDMWDSIYSVVKRSGCQTSIYADDITISGPVIYRRDIWEIKKTLYRYGHRFSPQKERHLIDKPALITGVVVSDGQLLLPNRQHKKLSELRKLIENSPSSQQQQSLGRQLRGRNAQRRQISRHLD